ncbi:hypothetical protein F4677DRAFT_126590 [Hypoxylon crocopeplum]|nr:hypothetical protein F4677DRAFT_126590 [Hypoxylon crocopeplum]
MDDPIVPLNTFLGLTWGGFALCVIGYCCRAYVRLVCHRRLLADDWLMLASLLMLLGIAILSQLSLHFVYTEAAVVSGKLTPGADFLNVIHRTLQGFGIFLILAYVGIWSIKIGFLLFFYRFGSKIRRFVILWWTFLVVTVACLTVLVGTGNYSCIFGSEDYIKAVCLESTGSSKDKAMFKLSIALDVISDALIIFFPISILWEVRITPRKRLLLSAVFSLVLLTIAVTIVRTIAYGGADETAVNIPWVWFWITTEWIVSFIVACLVSFRALFTEKYRKDSYNQKIARAAIAIPRPTGFRARAKQLHASFLETCRGLEDMEGNDIYALPTPVSGTLSVDFSGNEIRTTTTGSTDEHPGTTRASHPGQGHSEV